MLPMPRRRRGSLSGVGAAHNTPEPSLDDVLDQITIHSESRGDPTAVSPKGARGLMQVMPATSRDPGFGVRPSNGTPEDDVRLGKDYRRAMWSRYDGDHSKGWAAYNAGPGRVDGLLARHGDSWLDHAPLETRNYVNNNLGMLRSRQPKTPVEVMFDRPPPMVDHPTTFGQPDPSLPPDLAGNIPALPELPKAPPAARSTSPWAKENRQRTLLDIGSAFLSSPDFFEGLGKAGQAVGSRMDALKGQQTKREYGGPGDQFEITTDPETGERTVKRVPEFAAAIAEEREAKRPVPSTKDQVELRARLVRAIGNLPPEQRSAAYAEVLANPSRFGGIDTTGLPQAWDPMYTAVMGGMGQTVNQAENSEFRERQFGHRQTVDSARLGQGAARIEQGQQRLNKPPASVLKGGGKPAKANVPAGFLLD